MVLADLEFGSRRVSDVLNGILATNAFHRRVFLGDANIPAGISRRQHCRLEMLSW
jgi:hypothetical protein